MRFTRRSVLATVGSVAVAGCLGGDGGMPMDAGETATGETPAGDTKLTDTRRSSTPATATRTDAAGTDRQTPSDTPPGTESTTRTPPTPVPVESPETVEGAWTHPQFDPAATGHNPNAAGPAGVPGRAWSVTLEAEPQFPLAANGRLLAGVGGSVRAFDLATGETLWTRSFEGHARPRAISDGTVFVAERAVTNGEPREPTAMHALSLDGTKRWSLSDPVVPRAVADGTVYAFAGPDSGSLMALSTDDGSDRWRTSTDSFETEGYEAEAAQRFDRIAVGPEQLFATFSNSGSVGVVFALDRTDGSVSWSDTAPNHGSFPTVADGTVLSGGFYGRVDAWTTDGTHRWEAETAPPVSGIATADGRVFKSGGSSTSKPQVAALSLDTGSERWTRRLGRIAAVGDAIAYRTHGSTLSAVDPATGQDRWAVSLTGGVHSVRPIGETLLVTVGDATPRLQLLTSAGRQND